MIVYSITPLNLALVPNLNRKADNLPSRGADDSNNGATAHNKEA